jgi:hypothetical protein
LFSFQVKFKPHSATKAHCKGVNSSTVVYF